MGATVDCEAIGAGLLGQPINAVTSLALLAAGLFVFERARDVWVAAGLAAAGLGSFLFHGPLAPGGVWIHDVTLAWLILVVGLRARSLERVGALLGLAVIGPAFLVLGDAADVLTGALAAAVILLLVSNARGRDTLGPLILLGVSAVIGRLGATGGPLCDPDSLFQTHGVWHLGAAAAVAWWATGDDAGAPKVDAGIRRTDRR